MRCRNHLYDLTSPIKKIHQSQKMRCRIHLYDLTSIIGVCASCLTERLLALIEAEQQKHDPPPQPPPPLLFPRSVSPRRFRQELDEADLKHQWMMMMMPDRRFFSNPQFEITTNDHKMNNSSSSGSSSKKFSIIKKLFKSKSLKFLSEKRQKIDSHLSDSISSPTPGWFPSLTRKSKSSRAAADQSPFPSISTQYIRKRVVSPSRSSRDASIGTHPWQPWRRTPTPRSASPRRGKSSPNVRGMLVGVIPLVRASPSGLWSQGSYPGELKFSSKVAMSSSPSLRASRSRKLTDFTRLNFNR